MSEYSSGFEVGDNVVLRDLEGRKYNRYVPLENGSRAVVQEKPNPDWPDDAVQIQCGGGSGAIDASCLSYAREDVPGVVARVLGRPVRWAQEMIPAYDGHDCSVEVFNAEVKERSGLLKALRPVRPAIEKALEGGLIVIFHTRAQTDRNHPEINKGERS